ncbi:MAG: YggS family pyridoxal phosphate-dependent enzyme [Gemmataceae bacterium]
MTTAVRDVLSANLARVEKRLATACARAGRPRASVTLVAVTKTVSVEVATELAALGVRDLGENRPQELWRKAEALNEIRWHLIGHLQRNKIDRTLPLVHRIHSVDSLRLLEAIDAVGPADVLLEVNCSGEASKGGFSPAEVTALHEALQRLRQTRVAGLMTMAALEDDPERCRPTFRSLRALRDDLQQRVGGRHQLSELSMGMSNDFEVAVEEGATLVRIGTALFEGLPR